MGTLYLPESGPDFDFQTGVFFLFSSQRPEKILFRTDTAPNVSTRLSRSLSLTHSLTHSSFANYLVRFPFIFVTI